MSNSRLWAFLPAVVLFFCCGAAAFAQEPDAKYAAYLAEVQEKLPVKGTPVFDGAKLGEFRFGGQGAHATYSVVPVEGQPFGLAIRMEIPKRTDPPWNVQLETPPASEPLKKGDHVLVVLNVRCVEAPDGRGAASAILQACGPPWTGLGSANAAVGKDWKRVYVRGLAGQDFAAGDWELTVHLGSQAQTLEFGGVALLKLGANVDTRKLPFNPITYPGEEPDAAWRKVARERIEKHRKGDLTVAVGDKNGKPIAGARVQVEMKRHAYGFGTFLEGPVVEQTPDGEKMREWTLKLFNRCTTPIYWADWGWANPQVRERYLKMAQWAYDNKLTTRGHVIIYPGFQFMPSFMRKLEKDPPALRKRVLEQVVEVVEATKKFQFRDYDVTNELRDLPDLHRLLGKEAVAEWFRVAREHNSVSRMALNENTILTNGGATETEKENYAGWIQYLMDQGVGPDVIGLQGHFGENVTGAEKVWSILDRFAKFGKPLQITEYDLVTGDEEGQGRYMRDFLTMFFAHPATEAFTMWGFWEGRMWQPPGALIRKDWTLKPNGQAYVDLVLKEWWTWANGATGADGVFAARGFMGDYEITVTSGAARKTVPAKLEQAGTKVAVTVE